MNIKYFGVFLIIIAGILIVIGPIMPLYESQSCCIPFNTGFNPVYLFHTYLPFLYYLGAVCLFIIGVLLIIDEKYILKDI